MFHGFADYDGNEISSLQAPPETECLWHFSKSESHQYLLKHPVVDSFVWAKWQKIKGYFYWNLKLFLLFVTTLTWYIFSTFGGVSTKTLNLEGNKTFLLNETTYCAEPWHVHKAVDFWFYFFCVHVILQVCFI